MSYILHLSETRQLHFAHLFSRSHDSSREKIVQLKRNNFQLVQGFSASTIGDTRSYLIKLVLSNNLINQGNFPVTIF